eukprot:gene1778-33197_t
MRAMKSSSSLRLPTTTSIPRKFSVARHTRRAPIVCGAAAAPSDAGSTVVVQEASTKHASLKRKIFQVAALTDRGQRHNRLVSNAYEEERVMMETLLATLCSTEHKVTADAMSGEWEIVYATCELFRSSPFFLAIEEAFGDQKKSDLFFKLHQLQVCSWGASTIGRISQRIDFEKKEFYSEFDTTLFALTVIPLIGWFKEVTRQDALQATHAHNSTSSAFQT